MNVLEAIREIHLGSSLTDYANMINNELELIVKKNKKEVSKLLEIVEDFELNIAISSNDYSWEMALLHILCYFINGDFDNLRFLIKRLKVVIFVFYTYKDKMFFNLSRLR